ncbi:SAM-dependent methyltransferase [Leptolyngbya sp. PCC 6406]|uniref:SAM-dependent methyltransferase n=1 Tax=Leptolyngbya sp. PCC 6406 TaxID=1173264 RepID=UPI000316E777|nr:methyltransferase domain-containing protein [Leptolyngbya sp. PCC 6406]
MNSLISVKKLIKKGLYIGRLISLRLTVGNPRNLSAVDQYISRLTKKYSFDRVKDSDVLSFSSPISVSEEHHIDSMVCRHEHFQTPWFQRWSEEMGLYGCDELTLGAKFHRKAWEWCAIAQALAERGMLDPNKRGLGFAVGTEPLPALFAKYGASVLATDLDVRDRRSKAWAATNQHANSLEKLYFQHIVPKATFEDRVDFQFMDMRFPRDIDGKFDFIWSSCALEHLGNLMEGFGFIFKACSLLKPGGICVHTTEYNITSNSSTIECGPSVIYRRQDIENLDLLLRKSGLCLEKLDFWAGGDLHDRLYDTEPYYQSGKQHIKLSLDGYVTTSMVLIIYA